MRRECGRFAVLSNSEYVRVRKPNTLFNIIYIMRIRLPLNEMIGQRPLEASNKTVVSHHWRQFQSINRRTPYRSGYKAFFA